MLLPKRLGQVQGMMRVCAEELQLRVTQVMYRIYAQNLH